MMQPFQLVHSDVFRHILARADDAPAALDTSSRSGSIIACAVSCWVICGLAVVARFYARGRIQRVLGPEDWCVLAAYVSFYIAKCSGMRSDVDRSQLLALGFTVATVYGKSNAPSRPSSDWIGC
jgi:hypothetical protein